MKEDLQLLEEKVRLIKEELAEIRSRKRRVAHLIQLKGYSLKKIRDEVYLYTWETTGHSRAFWKCLGNIEKVSRHLIEEIKDERARALAEEYALLTRRENFLIEKINAILDILEEEYQTETEFYNKEATSLSPSSL